MKTFLYTIIILLIANACVEKKEQIILQVDALRASDIYYNTAVDKYITKYGSEHHKIATSYLNKSHAVKDKDLNKAIYYLKRSITLEPRYKSYIELAQLLSDDKNYEEAYLAYDVLIQKLYYESNGQSEQKYLFLVPDNNAKIEYVILSILAKSGIDYFDIPVWGFDKKAIRDRLVVDERFNYDTSNVDHKNIMAQFWNAEEVESYRSSLINLHVLLNSVSDTSSVFEINQKNISQFSYDNFNGKNNSDDYRYRINMANMKAYFLKEKQENPDEWISYNLNHTFKLDVLLNVLIYAVDTSAIACPVDMRELYHRLVVYGENGKILSDKIVAFQSGENLQTVSFNKDHFEISKYKRNWKNPYKKQDFDNEINNIELLSKKKYTITASGEIIESVIQ